MNNELYGITIQRWADAIALRLSDEWEGKTEFPDDAILLGEVLSVALKATPNETARLIGTGIIEESYFESLC